MTQVKFSEKLHITQQTLSRYENGNNPMPNELLENISKEFSIPISYFLGINTEDFAEDEICLIEYYRQVDVRIKKKIFDLIKTMAESPAEPL